MATIKEIAEISGDHAHAISAVINLQSDIHFFCLLYNFLPVSPRGGVTLFCRVYLTYFPYGSKILYYGSMPRRKV